MKFFSAFVLLCSFATRLVAQNPAPLSFSEPQQKFSHELAAVFQSLEKKNAAAVAGIDGWLFFGGELRLLSLGRFWGDDAAKVSRAHKPDLADPVPAILDFNQQLKARGIELVVVPVPPKAAIYPGKIVPGFDVRTTDPAPVLHRFYDELRAAGIDVLDLTSVFIRDAEPMFCKTDTHWSDVGCMLAAQAIAKRIREKLPTRPSRKEYVLEGKEIQIKGDLVDLLPRDTVKPPAEKFYLRRVSEKGTGAAVVPDTDSPLLVLGDSHTLVYHDFNGDRAGLVDWLAQELGFAPDLIGTRGSGATPVRISLYRRSLKDSGYLAKKKIVVWCFAAREFTEASEGWARVPVAK